MSEKEWKKIEKKHESDREKHAEEAYNALLKTHESVWKAFKKLKKKPIKIDTWEWIIKVIDTIRSPPRFRIVESSSSSEGRG